MQIGYCTNVHAGATLAETRRQLAAHATAVRKLVAPDEACGIGLWLSASAAAELKSAPGQLEEFAAWLRHEQLVPYTFNGFPYGDFHQEVVKHQVYLPTWWEPSRLEYTRDLIAIQHALLPPGLEGSISTMPICWGTPAPDSSELAEAANKLAQVAAELADLEARTGRLIFLCLEPEPGCLLDVTDDVIAFFQQYLLPGRDEQLVRRHIRVCHDVCHAAVMFEPQREVFEKLAAAGIGVGKVQVSSAVVADFEAAADQRAAMRDQLAQFNEPRYLHQTVIRQDGRTTFYQDLSEALAGPQGAAAAGSWRVHFHVPIYLSQFGHLQTSREEILACLAAARDCSDVRHFEVETYAWNVLPPELRHAQLAAGIAEELRWFRSVQPFSLA